MPSEPNIHPLAAMRKLLHSFACLALLTCVQYGLAARSQIDNTPGGKGFEVIAGLKAGAFGAVTEQQISEAQAGRLVPILEARFAINKDLELKARIAAALVKLGDTDDTYWNFLVEQATPAVESDAPNPKCLGSARCRSGPSPEYTVWAKAHNVSPGSPAEQALLSLPLKLEVLGSTGDRRGIPLLREALRSPNFEIQSVAAEGLTEAHDKDSIPLIIEACKRVPVEVAPLIAEYLKRFDDPRARSAAATYLPKDPDPIDALKQGDLAPVFIEKVTTAMEVQAIPILEKQFELSDDPTTKAHIASALVRLGVKASTYWNFLVEQAKVAVDSDAPSLTTFDSEGKRVRGLSPEFIAWARDHNTSTDSAVTDAMVEFPQRVLFLALTGDPRGIPLLRKALLTSNVTVQHYGGMGLAKLQDKDSIPLIIEACKRAPASAADLIVEPLVYFDDPRAQTTVDMYMPPEKAKVLREARANGKTPLR